MLAAALELIGDATEVRSVTMEAIAERAGISKVTLYRRWPSKAALMADALLERLSDTIPLDPEKAPAIAISEHIHSLGRMLDGKVGQLIRFVAAECLVEPTAMQAFRDRYLGVRRRIATEIIGRGLEDGSFAAPCSARDCHDALYGALYYRFIFGLGATDPASIDVLMTVTLQAQAPDPAPTSAPPG